MAGTSVDAPPPNKVFVEKYLYFAFDFFETIRPLCVENSIFFFLNRPFKSDRFVTIKHSCSP